MAPHTGGAYIGGFVMILAAAIKYRIEKTGKCVVLCGARHGDVFDQLEALGFDPHF